MEESLILDVDKLDEDSKIQIMFDPKSLQIKLIIYNE